MLVVGATSCNIFGHEIYIAKGKVFDQKKHQGSSYVVFLSKEGTRLP